MSMFTRRKLAKRLSKIGTKIVESYLVYLNNDEPKSFDSYDSCLGYIKQYREDNQIFNLSIYRIETYSL